MTNKVFELIRQMIYTTSGERRQIYDYLRYKYGISRQSARYMMRNIVNGNIGRENDLKEERKCTK